MFYPDLNQECQVDQGPYVRAVGWLARDHPFPKGPVSPAFLEALRRQLRDPWQPVAAGGSHRCEFCPQSQDGPARGASNLWVPGEEWVYVAPELVLHYIETHGYSPPPGFIAAILDCPDQDSLAYRERMRQFPAWWVKDLADVA
jgi:hypothetical protein